MGFNASVPLTLHYGAAREWGWCKNVHGMFAEGQLRRESCAAEVRSQSCHDLAIRIQPDDVWHFGKPEQATKFWS